MIKSRHASMIVFILMIVILVCANRVVDQKGIALAIESKQTETTPLVSRFTEGGATTLVSVFDNGEPFIPNGLAVLSANGRYVSMVAYGSYIEEGDENGVADVYVYDSLTLETELVSVALDKKAPAQGAQTGYAPLSADGRYVAYSSYSSDIVNDDANGTDDIFVYDRDQGITERISVSSNGEEADRNSFRPVMSHDGRYVAFMTNATNLDSGDTNQDRDVYVHDRSTRKTKRISYPIDAGEGGGTLEAMSGNGQYIMFTARYNAIMDDVERALFIHDQFENHTSVALHDMDNNSVWGFCGGDNAWQQYCMSTSGRYYVFSSENERIVEDDTNGMEDVFLVDRDPDEGFVKRISLSSTGAQNEHFSRFPAISADGQHVTFETYGKLVPEDTNESSDIYVYHVQSDSIELISVTPAGESGNSRSNYSHLSADGQKVVFWSQASDLVAGDYNSRESIFLRTSGGEAIPLHTPFVNPVDNSDDDGTFVVRWSNVVNASQYELHEIGISGTSQQIYVGPGRSYTVTDKGYGTWCYKVRALGPNESQSEWSTLSCIEIPPCVPYFSQEDPRWASHPLQTDGRCDAVCNTIGACGCTLTAATMLFAYYGADLTPNTLSDAMGTQACPFVWGAGAAATGGKATYLPKKLFTWLHLDNELNQNRRPVILGMSKGANTHWVLVTSGQGEVPANYLIHDPWPKNGPDTSLDVYRKQGWSFNSLVTYAGVGVCKPAPTTALHINLTNNLRKEIEPNAASIGSLAMSRRNKTEQDSITGSISVYHLNVDTAVVQLQALSENAAIIEMQVWTDSQANPQWQPYDVLAWVPWEAEDDMVYARFRDKEGNTSQVVQDSMWPLIGPPSETDPEPRVLNLLPLILNR